MMALTENASLNYGYIIRRVLGVQAPGQEWPH